jgi:hypothetical protein
MTSEELLAPEDIKITYSEGGDQQQIGIGATKSKNKEIGSKSDDSDDDSDDIGSPMLASPVVDRNAYNNYESWNKIYGDEKGSQPPEPPRVLPLVEKEVEKDEPKAGRGSSINDVTQFLRIFWPPAPTSRFLLLRPLYWCYKIIDPCLLDCNVIYGRPLILFLKF